MSLTAVSKFKFVSPGIFIDEIDQSQIPTEAQKMGPLIIGRAQRGPGMRPVTVGSYSEFVEIFGNPVAGGKLTDTWRDGNLSAPTYAAYAAQAYLRNNSPVTFVRLLGAQHKNPTSSPDGKAGWETSFLETAGAEGEVNDEGGAYGLFVIPSGSVEDGTAATSEFAFNGIPSEDTTITLEDAMGKTVVFEVKQDAAAVTPGNVAITTTTAPTSFATALDVAINAHAFNITSARVGDQLTLTQDVGGTAGDKTITLSDSTNWDSVCSANVPSGFTGGAAEVAFTCTIAALDDTAGNYDNMAFTLISNDAANTTRTYTLQTTALATGTEIAAGNIRVRLNGLADKSAVATEIAAAINHDNGHGTDELLTVVANAVAGQVVVTQPTGTGKTGATAITVTNLVAADLTINGGAVNTVFADGAINGSTATFTFDGHPAEDTTITLTDTAGTSAVFEVNTDNAAVTTVGAVSVNTSAESDFATAFNTAVNGQNTAGNLDITSGVAAPTVTLTQNVLNGAFGNKQIIYSNKADWDAAVTGDAPSAFTSGVNSTQSKARGTLAAVWYLDEGVAALSGTMRGTGIDVVGHPFGATRQFTSGTSAMIKSLPSGDAGVDNEFKVAIFDKNGSKVIESAFNFNRASDKYIRKVFNTNPQLTNNSIYTTAQGLTNYWLGETFERGVADTLTGSGEQGFGVIMALSSGSLSYASMKKEYYPSETGFIISQDENADPAGFDAGMTSRAKKLFKFVSIDGGSEWNQNNLKISIENIKPPKSSKQWATFTVTVRDITDADLRPVPIEKFSNLNLDPSSPNYIARRIGDRSITWDHTDKRNKLLGEYENQSRWIRVHVEPGNNRGHVPFGCYGPVVFQPLTLISGSTLAQSNDHLSFGEVGPDHMAGFAFKNSLGVAQAAVDGQVLMGPVADSDAKLDSLAFSCEFDYPEIPLRVSASTDGIINPLKAYWGVDLTEKSTAQFENSVKDILRSNPGQTKDKFDLSADENAEVSWFFTLDDIRFDEEDQTWAYDSGSRQRGAASMSETDHEDERSSFTARSGSFHLLTGSNAGINKFTTVLYGGFDGLDIQEREPFRNSAMDPTNLEGTGDYAFHTLMRSIDMIDDAEVVECNLMAIPGITVPEVTKRLVSACEERADALAIIDIENDYVPDTEDKTEEKERIGNVDDAVRKMKDREIDSSYGAAYYPWVQIKDDNVGTALWVPPSVVALGAMAYTENRKDVWFAPAGFSRGGLTEEKAGGQTVMSARQQLTSKQRDKLYDANVNPIASFPAEGIVIFGQKTLQLTRSALDRINVRRLLIFLKKEVSRIANRTLFEQNVKETWNAFSGEVDLLLSSVRTRFGLTDYRLKLDETTTTPELIDRNILYAKIYLKPARAIEFIALDFIITSSGASFED